MRRLLFIVLLTILPLQFSWAGVSAYCGHERGSATQHFGHHEHQHHAGPDAASTDKASSASMQADADCGTCQLGASQPVPPTSAALLVPDTEPPCDAHHARYGSHIPPGPERPDREAPSPAVRFGGAVVIGALLPA
ncbi:cation efflux protein, CzcI family [Aquabacterium sp.]|uniref:cation efflux protein, CzcI family n=1 Tax=Aquabacterium sp. TaxID=1872578 RepID=UPI002C2C4555|nr:cation efflux protein, CzcI family [Aquabacterium sp.]HSW04580.1 DUF2946 family protein [Aquabacterium sp.]